MIDGFGIVSYRSFGGPEVQIADLGRVNLFIGRNNVGKSNILRFLKNVIGARGLGQAPELKSEDVPVGGDRSQTVFSIQFRRDGYGKAQFNQIESMFRQAGLHPPPNDGSFWFGFSANQPYDPSPSSEANWLKVIHANYDEHATNRLTERLCAYTGGEPAKRVSDIVQRLHRSVSVAARVHLVVTFRGIMNDGPPLSGVGIIPELRQLQSPVLARYDESKRRFGRIIAFVRSVLVEPEAEMEIPAAEENIYIRIGLDGRPSSP